MAIQDALQLKEQGNKLFTKGHYAAAEGLYSQAIIADPKDPVLYTNRAMARCKLHRWEDAMADCQTSLNLAPDHIKAVFYQAEAQLALKDYDHALNSARRAYELYSHSEQGIKSLTSVTQLVLRCKKARWDDMERRRLREGSNLERELVDMMEHERDAAISLVTDPMDVQDVQRDWDRKLETLKETFTLARGEAGKRREVPDWAIDDITFGILVDPVMTKTGKSYERASLLEHLRRNKTDPVTREPLDASDLRPNIDLREACAEFLDKNGWAVDW